MRVLRWMLMAVATLLLLAPVLIFGLYAFSERWFYPALLPPEWTLEPVRRELSKADTLAALWTSLQIATLVSGLSLLVGYPAARALELNHIPARRSIYTLLFLPTVVPPVATGIGLNIAFLRLGLDGTALGVALVHLVPVLPYVVFTLGGVFAAYDRTYEHQARVLGANRWRIFSRVTLPLIGPGVVVATLFAFLISWSQYVLTLLIGGGRVITLPILLFATVSGGRQNSISVQSLLFVAPLIIVLALASRYLAQDRVRGGEIIVP